MCKEGQMHRSQDWAVLPFRLWQFLKSYCVSSGRWRTNYVRRGKLDILQEEEGGKTVIVILRTDTQAGEEEKKKKRSPTVSHLGPVETQSLSTMGQVLERIELKLLGSWCNWTTSPPTNKTAASRIFASIWTCHNRWPTHSPGQFVSLSVNHTPPSVHCKVITPERNRCLKTMPPSPPSISSDRSLDTLSG